MNFFESQDRVRKNTFQLVFLFTLAVLTLIIMTNLLVMAVLGYLNSDESPVGGAFLQQMDWRIFAAVSAAVGIVVLLGSLYKILTLSSGGKTVAEALGGKLIPQNTDDPQQRQLLNVVEEMAIASGTPSPPVYLMTDEAGINAFAAGFSPRDAVIGITQGTIDELSRDELQGVVAHEFSHIFNGDMRLNIRLMGVLHGILIIGMIGYYILRGASHSRSDNKGAGGVLILGVGLMIIGFAGTFFGGLIKAAVSRQREYLADASAVQFTRNPDGIAGALKKIGGLDYGSNIDNPGAPEISHAFFARGVSDFVQSLSATHPPLTKRILRIDPQWDGEFVPAGDIAQPPEGEEPGTTEQSTREGLAGKIAAVVAGAAMDDVVGAIDQAGNPKPETIDYARALVSELPTSLAAAAREPYGARAVIYALVFDPGQTVRDRQLAHLQANAEADVFNLTQKLIPEMDGLDIKFRLPLIDLVIPALKQLSIRQYESFRANLVALIEMNSRVDLLEWSLQKILFNHLDGQFLKPKRIKAGSAHLDQLSKEIGLFLSVMAHAGHQDQTAVEGAFDAATKSQNFSGLPLVAKTDIRLSDLDRALQELVKLKPLAKRELLRACAASVAHDQRISSVEIELLRAFSDALDCPLPPVIPS